MQSNGEPTMAISAISPIGKYTGNGSQVEFPVKSGSNFIPFRYNSHIKVAIIDTDNDYELLVEGVDYELTGGPSAGLVTFTTAPEDGVQIHIYRKQPIETELEVSQLTTLSAESLVGEIDKVASFVQDLEREVQDISGDLSENYLSLNGEYWDAQDKIVRGIANPVDGSDAVNYSTLQSEMASAGSGNVVGPSASVSGAIALFDGETGRTLQGLGEYSGDFTDSDGAVIARHGGRMFVGSATSFDTGVWSNDFSSLDPKVADYHGWAFRDGVAVFGDIGGSMALVGHSQSSRWSEYPGYPTNHPATMGVAGFVVNDEELAPAWGGYFDAKRDGGGFTVAVELACTNMGTETEPNPANYRTGGAQAGVVSWKQSGGGLDVVYKNSDLVKDIAAYDVYLPSFREGGPIVAWANGWEYAVGRVAAETYGGTQYVCLVAHTSPASGTFSSYRTENPSHWALLKSGNWAISTAFNVGDLARDTVDGQTYRCLVAHTSASSGTFSSDRAAHITYWKALPGAKVGRVIATGALTETYPGTAIFVADAVPERHQYRWHRSNGEVSAVIWASNTTVGTSSINQTFVTGGVNFNGFVESIGIKPGVTANADTSVLDYYGEGVWTPSLTFGGTGSGVAYAAGNAGTWTRVGDTLFVRGTLQLSAKGSSTGSAAIGGLPFTVASVGGANLGYWSGFNAGIAVPPQLVPSGTSVLLYKAGAGGASALIDTDMTNSSRIDFSFSCKV